MVFNLQMEGANNGGSEQAGSSDDGQIVAALRKTMRKEVEAMVINIVQTVVMPVVENLIRKVVVKEVILHCGERNDAHEINMSPESRSLQLKFLDEVSLPVLTGKEIKGKGGTAMRLAVVDKTTGELVNSGPEASAKVEILVLRANCDDNEQDWSVEDSNSRIIGESDKKKPYFAKRMYVYLKEGKGILCNVKLGHGSHWTKSCECRLGARVVDNVSRNTVKEAWTESFIVQDKRSKCNEKHAIPSLSDEVWRLHNIFKGGKIDKRLQGEGISTVEGFLIRLLKDPEGLKNIVNLGLKKWEVLVNHARTCPSGKRMYCYINSQQKTGIIFDILGKVLRLYSESQYADTNMLSENNKVDADKLLSAAITHWENVISFDDENSVHQYFASSGYPEYGHYNTGAAPNISNSSFQEIIANSFCIDEVEKINLTPSELSQCFNFNFENMFLDFDNETNAVIPICKAPKRWKKLFCVSRLFFMRKMVASEGNQARKKPRVF